ncbi:MAG: hypothetical protein AAB937_00585 [Patescibacteria group bacterium]
MKYQHGKNQSVVMARKRSVSAALYDVLSRFSICSTMPQREKRKIIVRASGKELVDFTNHSIDSAVASLTDSIFWDKSMLLDQFVSMDDMDQLVRKIQLHIKRLDHIGFCYTVLSQEDERKRIVAEVSKTNCHLYEMDSVDLAKWYFIGDKKRWQDTMIELLPVQLPNKLPEDLQYWMPHIHLDINTSLSAEEIVQMSTEIFGNSREPILYTDPEWGTHCVRIWLGVASGVNIQLDLSTNVRNLQWLRKNMLYTIL